MTDMRARPWMTCFLWDESEEDTMPVRQTNLEIDGIPVYVETTQAEIVVPAGDAELAGWRGGMKPPAFKVEAVRKAAAEAVRAIHQDLVATLGAARPDTLTLEFGPLRVPDGQPGGGASRLPHIGGAQGAAAQPRHPGVAPISGRRPRQRRGTDPSTRGTIAHPGRRPSLRSSTSWRETIRP